MLLRSRRRCCICFGLNRETSLKTGQIAHLDRDSSNNAEDNLAFLCFQHHDEYDSRPSQSKGLTVGEVKQFRAELDEALGKALSMPVHFGSITVPKADPYAGQYIREGRSNDSAEINVTPLPDGSEAYPTYAVTGLALWGTNRENGPNLGELSFIGTVENGVIKHVLNGYDPPHIISLRFENDRLIVEEENWLGTYGMNVFFFGEYDRAA